MLTPRAKTSADDEGPPREIVAGLLTPWAANTYANDFPAIND